MTHALEKMEEPVQRQWARRRAFLRRAQKQERQRLGEAFLQQTLGHLQTMKSLRSQGHRQLLSQNVARPDAKLRRRVPPGFLLRKDAALPKAALQTEKQELQTVWAQQLPDALTLVQWSWRLAGLYI